MVIPSKPSTIRVAVPQEINVSRKKNPFPRAKEPLTLLMTLAVMETTAIQDQGSGIKISNNRTVHFAYSLGLPHLKVLCSQRVVNDELICVTGGIVIRRLFSLCAGYFLGGGAARDFRERRSSKSLRVRRQKITVLPS